MRPHSLLTCDSGRCATLLRHMISARNILTFSTLCLFLTALNCTGHFISDSSVPIINKDSGINGNEDYRNCTLKLDEIHLSVNPLNSRIIFGSMGVIFPIIPVEISPNSEELNRDPFVIQIKLFPKSETIQFEPLKVTLELNGITYQPVAYKKMVARNHPGMMGDCDTGCDYNELFLESDDSIVITNNLCIDIKFPVETYKTQYDFSLNLNGISKNGEPMKIPTLQFRYKKTSDGFLYR